MTFSIIVPSNIREEQKESIYSRVADMTMEELESQIFEDSLVRGSLSAFGIECEAEIARRRDIHNKKINLSGLHGEFVTSTSKVIGKWEQAVLDTYYLRSAMPVIRKVVPSLIASEIVGVQPMSTHIDGLPLGTFASMSSITSNFKSKYYDPVALFDTEATFDKTMISSILGNDEPTRNQVDAYWGDVLLLEQGIRSTVSDTPKIESATATFRLQKLKAAEEQIRTVSNLGVSVTEQLDDTVFKQLMDYAIAATAAQPHLSHRCLIDTVVDIKPSLPKDPTTITVTLPKPRKEVSDIVWMTHEI